MTDFDFTAIKPTVTKAADVPAVTKTRKVAGPNPFLPHYTKSDAKRDADDNGQWLNVTLPGAEKTNEKGRKTHGETVAKAQSLLIAASKEYSATNGQNRSVSFRHTDNGDETVTLYFRAIPRGTRNTKSTDESTEAK